MRRRVDRKASHSYQLTEGSLLSFSLLILGIDIQEIRLPRRAAVVVGGPPVFTFRVWDFAGQQDYYATHQCFLSQRSLFLLIWDATELENGEFSQLAALLNVRTILYGRWYTLFL